MGATNEIKVTLPYSGEEFGVSGRSPAKAGVPANLLIIGTMNTAVRKAGRTEAHTLIQAWQIGDIGFASVPGELFVEWGLKIKAESPFPWTFPVMLGGDCLGCFVTEQAWQAGGYESLITQYSPVSVAGVRQMVDTALGLLQKLWKSAAV